MNNSTLTAEQSAGLNWHTLIGVAIFHVLAVAALFTFSWSNLTAALILWWVAGSLGIGIGYHRLLTHRGFKTPKWVEYTLSIFPNVAIGAGGMTFDVDGSLWLYGLSNDPACSADVATCLWSVNPTDASATFVGTSGDVAEFVLGLAATCDPGVVAITGPAASGPPAGSSLELVDTATAALTEIVPVSDIAFPEGLDYAADGTLWAIALGQIAGFASAQTSLIDPATGATTNAPITVGGDAFSGFLLGLAIDPPVPCPPPPTPEPLVLQPTFTG
jgi:hypothetical protein